MTLCDVSAIFAFVNTQQCAGINSVTST